MPLKKAFVARGVHMMEIDEFLASKLESAGYAGVKMQKTPLGTRIIVQAARPGLVIGKKGKTVKELTYYLEDHFDIENPNIEVEEIKEPELNAQIMAERLASGLEKGKHYRRAAYSILRRIIRRGARGAEIIIGGKLTSQRSRVQKFREGIVSKCGTPWDEAVSYGVSFVVTKTGCMGFRLLIMPGPSEYRLPDNVKIYDHPLEEPVVAPVEGKEESLFKSQEESGVTREIKTKHNSAESDKKNEENESENTE